MVRLVVLYFQKLIVVSLVAPPVSSSIILLKTTDVVDLCPIFEIGTSLTANRDRCATCGSNKTCGQVIRSV